MRNLNDSDNHPIEAFDGTNGAVSALHLTPTMLAEQCVALCNERSPDARRNLVCEL
jgi:hypothetical protein